MPKAKTIKETLSALSKSVGDMVRDRINRSAALLGTKADQVAH